MNKLITIFVIFWANAANSSFYEGAKRGWFWFEDPPALEEKTMKEMSPRRQQEIIKKELEDLRYEMLNDPSVENVRSYRLKEMQMWQTADKLYDAWQQTSFLYPELRSSPNNVYAVKLDRQMQKEKQQEQILDFLKEYDLILFRNNNCKYCSAFEPILSHFSSKYRIKVEAVSLDKSLSSYFENKNASALITALKITDYPTVIAVHKKNNEMFELVRGLVTLDELEEYSLLAMQYIKSKQL